MRWIYLAVIILFAVSTLIFALQNLESTTVSFLSFKVRAPLAVLPAGGGDRRQPAGAAASILPEVTDLQGFCVRAPAAASYSTSAFISL